MTHDNVTDIVERLVAEKYESDEHGIWAIPRNPEGREAAQDGLVEALEEIGRLAETLCEYDGEVCNIAEYILSAHRSALSAIKGDKS